MGVGALALARLVGLAVCFEQLGLAGEDLQRVSRYDLHRWSRGKECAARNVRQL